MISDAIPSIVSLSLCDSSQFSPTLSTNLLDIPNPNHQRMWNRLKSLSLYLTAQLAASTKPECGHLQTLEPHQPACSRADRILTLISSEFSVEISVHICTIGPYGWERLWNYRPTWNPDIDRSPVMFWTGFSG